MTSLAIPALVFVCVFLAAFVGTAFRRVLPDDHLTPDSKDVVKLAMGLVATVVALVLGLLVSSAKSTFDAVDSELTEVAANVSVLDRTLAQYGPETKRIRESLRRVMALRLAATWPEDATAARVDMPESTPVAEGIDDQIQALSPQNHAQQILQARAEQLVGEILHARWLVLGRARSQIQMPLLVVLVFWQAALFFSFGLFAPRNATVVAMLFVAAVSVAAAIFLILELNQPFGGMLKVSSAPLRYTLAHLGE
jgi:hypothetical protein